MYCGIFLGVKGVRVACLSEERKVKSEKSKCIVGYFGELE
mgnify:CR=1 FL=1